MHNKQLHTAISAPRFSRYYNACGDNERAIALYRANIALSQQLFGVISVFEVILRNSIDRHMTSLQGDEWLENAVQPGGSFDITADCEIIFHVVQEAIHNLGFRYTHEGLITKLTFGVWTYLFSPKQYAAMGNTLLYIFPNRPFNTKQKIVFENLRKINELRNRIAHHEPICFDGISISSAQTERRYHLIMELMDWMGCSTAEMLSGIDQVKAALAAIAAI